MRVSTRVRALIVIATVTAAAVVAGTGAFGVITHGPPTVAAAGANGVRFAASPDQARVGHIPNTMHARSISTCPSGASTVLVQLTQGTTVFASALATADANGKWSLFMSIPSHLAKGTYAVTAACYTTSGPTSSTPAAKTYRPQNFKVVVGFCPANTTTSTTAPCRTTTTGVGAGPGGGPGQPGQPGQP